MIIPLDQKHSDKWRTSLGGMFSLACVSVMLMVIHNKVIMKTIVCAEFWRAVSVLLHLFGALAVLTDCWWPSMTNTLSASSLADQQFLSQRDEWFLKLDRQKESCHTSVAWDSRKVNQIQFETVFMKLNMFFWGHGFISITISHRKKNKTTKQRPETEQILYTDNKWEASVLISEWQCGSSYQHVSYVTHGTWWLMCESPGCTQARHNVYN